MTPENLALNAALWQPKVQETENHTKNRVVQDFASALLEQKEGRPEERINPVKLKLGKNGYLHDEDNDRVNLRWKTPLDRLENQGYLLIEAWARNAPTEYAAWISPPNKDVGYSEARITIYGLEKRGDDTFVSLRGFCLPYSQEKCLDIANEMGQSSYLNNEFDDAEQLRAFPVFFVPPEGSGWVSYLEKIIVEPEVWETVRSGQDVINKEETKRIAEDIVERNIDAIIEARTEYDHLVVGAQMEAQAQSNGIKLQAIGGCGISNTEALRIMNQAGIGAYDALFATAVFGDTVQDKFKPEHNNSFPCPKCERPIPSGKGITKCPYEGCSAKKDDYQSGCD